VLVAARVTSNGDARGRVKLSRERNEIYPTCVHSGLTRATDAGGGVAAEGTGEALSRTEMVSVQVV
jgi:hypothetical protein